MRVSDNRLKELKDKAENLLGRGGLRQVNVHPAELMGLVAEVMRAREVSLPKYPAFTEMQHAELFVEIAVRTPPLLCVINGELYRVFGKGVSEIANQEERDEYNNSCVPMMHV